MTKFSVHTPTLLATMAALAMHATFANAGDATLQLSPGRVQFTMKANGEWTGFGVRGERMLLDHGGLVIYSERAGSTLLDERAQSVHGGMRGVNATSEPLFEGMPGGARYPSIQPDDDGDGRIDEDPWDRVDNDGDGQVDEDFAAIGDEMTVAVFSSRGDATLTVRQECYAWSLANIDGMIGSTIVVENNGTTAISRARIGIDLEAASGLEVGDAPVIEASSSRSALDATFAEEQVVFDDHDRGLAALILVSRAEIAAGGAWEVHKDHDKVVAVSPELGDLGPGRSVTLYLALVALPADDLKAAHAIRNAHRTVVGDASARFIPPPVSVMARSESESGAAGHPAVARESGNAYWNMAGKLQETLLVGSPNPFHDTVSFDYEIPNRVVDADGVEHLLEGGSQPTSVKVYNVAGRLVATLVDQLHSPGKYRVDWTARGEDGAALASGVYYVKLQIGRRSVTMRMVQLK